MIKPEHRESHKAATDAVVDPRGPGSAKPEFSRQATMNPESPEPKLLSESRIIALPEENANDPYLGAMIDQRYLIEERIGEGGMGVVYRCQQTSINKIVAMKVLRSDMARSKDAIERFANEARSATAIGNAHIIDISDFGRLPDNAAYFIMEYLEGTPLVDLSEAGVALEPRRVAHIALQLTVGLAAAHQAGIVHRDLKPDNIFLVKRGLENEFVKILDFGIAKVNASTSKLTQAGQVFGTPHYMSPEQADGARIDHRADVYALGVILYELSTGRLPFDAESSVAVLTQHIHRKPTPPSELPGLNLAFPPGLEALILKCLAKSPKNRFQSMEELGLSLEQFLGGDEDLARKYQEFERSFPRDSHRKRSPKDAAKRRWPLALSLSILPLAAGAALWTSRTPTKQVATSREAQSAPPVTKTKNEVVGTTIVKAPTGDVNKPVPTTVTIQVIPAGAHIFNGEHDLGPAPLELELKEKGVEVQVRLAGYQSQTLLLDGQEKAVSLELSALTKKRNSRRRRDRNDLGGHEMPTPWD